MKCSVCTAYCPVTLVNPKFPGPKQSGPDGERYRLKDIKYFDKTLEFCLNCKKCEVACPSDVKIADIIQIVRIKHAPIVPPVRNLLLARTDTLGAFSTTMSFVVNPILRSKWIKGLLDTTLKIDDNRQLPQYSSHTFRRLFKKKFKDIQQKFSEKVTYFHGCYVNYNYPQLGVDLITILNAVGIGIELIHERCCGMPLIMNGLVENAKHNAKVNIQSFKKCVEKNQPILTTSPTCALTIRDEYNHILGLDNEDIRDSIFMATRYLYDKIDEGRIKLKFKKGTRKVYAYHPSCHIEKLGWTIYSSRLLTLIPDTKVIVLDSACCGLAGTHGYKKENYNDSQNIGKVLFKMISKINPDIVVSDCESCKWQIEMSTPYKVMNPISVLADALDIQETMRANNVKL